MFLIISYFFLLFPEKNSYYSFFKKIKSAKNISVILFCQLYLQKYEEKMLNWLVSVIERCADHTVQEQKMANHKFIIWITTLFHAANRMV